MYKKDRLKGILALVLFSAIGLSYYFFGNEISKSVAVVCLVIWVLGLLYFRKMGKD